MEAHGLCRQDHSNGGISGLRHHQHAAPREYDQPALSGLKPQWIWGDLSLMLRLENWDQHEPPSGLSYSAGGNVRRELFFDRRTAWENTA
jgi:hypothetical protein